MDKNMIEKKIAAVEEQITRDEAEINRSVATIKRSQDRKRFLEGRVRDNRQVLSDLNNRKAMLAIEGSIGKVDDSKLARLVQLLEEHGSEIGKEEDEGPEIRSEAE